MNKLLKDKNLTKDELPVIMVRLKEEASVMEGILPSKTLTTINIKLDLNFMKQVEIFLETGQ